MFVFMSSVPSSVAGKFGDNGYSTNYLPFFYHAEPFGNLVLWA